MKASLGILTLLFCASANAETVVIKHQSNEICVGGTAKEDCKSITGKATLTSFGDASVSIVDTNTLAFAVTTEVTSQEATVFSALKSYANGGLGFYITDLSEAALSAKKFDPVGFEGEGEPAPDTEEIKAFKQRSTEIDRRIKVLSNSVSALQDAAIALILKREHIAGLIGQAVDDAVSGMPSDPAIGPFFPSEGDDVASATIAAWGSVRDVLNDKANFPPPTDDEKKRLIVAKMYQKRLDEARKIADDNKPVTAALDVEKAYNKLKFAKGTIVLKPVPIAFNKAALVKVKLALADSGAAAFPKGPDGKEPLKGLDVELTIEPFYAIYPGASIGLQVLPTAKEIPTFGEGGKDGPTVNKSAQLTTSLTLIPCWFWQCDKDMPFRVGADLNYNPLDTERAWGFGPSVTVVDFVKLGLGVSYLKTQFKAEDAKPDGTPAVIKEDYFKGDFGGGFFYFSVSLIALPPFQMSSK